MISIITPTYNREVLLQTTIASIQAQTNPNWELIVVDDGSTDNTATMMQRYAADQRIRYVQKNNTGQADSLNHGVSYAKGEFITFLDSDDEAYPDWLQTVQESMSADTGIVCASARRKFIDGTIKDERLNDFLLFGKKMKLKFTCGSCFIRKSLFDEVKGYDSSLKSNIQTDLGYRLMAALEKSNLKVVTLDDKFLVQINVHAGERIRTNWHRRKEGGIQFINKHYAFIYEHDKKEIANIYGSIAFSCFKLKKRMESVQYLVKAIKHNPFRMVNYMRVIRYSLS